MENPGSLNELLNRWATSMGISVASAFFGSLERFACVNITTEDSDDDDDNEEEAKDGPRPVADLQVNVGDSNNQAPVEEARTSDPSPQPS